LPHLLIEDNPQRHRDARIPQSGSGTKAISSDWLFPVTYVPASERRYLSPLTKTENFKNSTEPGVI
jgi:hypothetical protein